MIDGAEKQGAKSKRPWSRKDTKNFGAFRNRSRVRNAQGSGPKIRAERDDDKMDKINVGKLQESMAAIMPVFEKSCRYIASHSQPLETQGIRPTLDELKDRLRDSSQGS